MLTSSIAVVGGAATLLLAVAEAESRTPAADPADAPVLGADECVRPYTNARLLCRNKIELAGRLFVEDGAFFLVAAAPVFVAAWNSQEVAWADALLARVVFV